MKINAQRLAAFACGALFGCTAALAQSAGSSSLIMHLTVDARDAPQEIVHARLQIPVSPGYQTLVYPKWIPGEHGPTGPIGNLTGLIRGNGQLLSWGRDDVDMYAFHVNVPQDVTSLDVMLDFLATAGPGAFISGASVGATFAVVNWNELLLYPEHMAASHIAVKTELQLPAEWRFGTALPVEAHTNGDIRFKSVPLNQLIDSPLIAGQHFREIPLSSAQTPAHFLDLVADNEEALAMSNQQVAAYRRLVQETGLLFGSRHYTSYHFLVSLSDELGNTGLEHHQSSDDRLPEETFTNPDQAKLEAWLLPHEFTHSWNGKYRRPAGLLTLDYQTPMKGGLLWVYEGLTTYLGELLATRIGLWTPEEFKQELALKAADMSHRPGRTWRNLEDTAVSAQILSGAGGSYSSWRRSVDYYSEGELIWLEIDTILREQSKGKASLDDFCKRFFGAGESTGPVVVPYTFDDLVASLKTIAPYDWRGYLIGVLTTNQPQAPLGGLRRGGYELAYQHQPPEMERLREKAAHHLDARFSLGSAVATDGTIEDVTWKSPLFTAKIVPGSKLITVDGKKFAIALLRQALDSAAKNATPITLRIARGSREYGVTVAYNGGERYPTLRRIPSQPDVLDTILEPLAMK